jgi:maleylacetate reductase
LPFLIAANGRDLDDTVEMINAVNDLRADCLVTIGAGSISDACKNVKLGSSNNVKTRDDMLKLRAIIDFDSGIIGPPDVPLNPPTLKLICIPTSLSAGEYNCKSGSLDRKSGKKSPYGQPDCMPDVIICDPYLARQTPEWVWMSTGVRALDHAVETLANPKMNVSDPLIAAAFKASEEAIGLIMNGLYTSKLDGSSVEARDMCQRGAWKASLAVVRECPMGGSHAIGHILGPVGGVGHGHTSCVMCAAVNRWNYRANAKQQDHIKEVIVASGVLDKMGVKNTPDLQLWQILAKFIRAIGMPQSLGEVGIGPDKFELIAKETLEDFWSRMNPIPLDTTDKVMEILELAK